MTILIHQKILGTSSLETTVIPESSQNHHFKFKDLHGTNTKTTLFTYTFAKPNDILPTFPHNH